MKAMAGVYKKNNECTFPDAMKLRILHHVERVKIIYINLNVTDIKVLDNITKDCALYDNNQLLFMVKLLEEHYPILYPRYH